MCFFELGLDGAEQHCSDNLKEWNIQCEPLHRTGHLYLYSLVPRPFLKNGLGTRLVLIWTCYSLVPRPFLVGGVTPPTRKGLGTKLDLLARYS